MRRTLSTIFALLVLTVCYGQSRKILVKTNFGNFKVLLYDYTPKHRQLLLDAIEKNVYHGAEFNRVIADFVIQGGELDEDILAREAKDATTVPKRLAPEFDKRAFHKVGALGAGRDDNPTESSFLNQLYFVVGKSVTEDDLRALEQKKGIKYTIEQRQAYLKNGGQPRLDQDYTVFGEIYEGLDVVMAISKVGTNASDRPLEKVLFTMEVIK
jgi:cyclophilin family peptidyl-prolyl cis-trans isomerase